MRVTIRALTSLVALVLLLWIARLIAHSKTPPAEGIWREVAPEDITHP